MFKVTRRITLGLDAAAATQLITLSRHGTRSASEAMRAALSLSALLEECAGRGFSEVIVRNPTTGATQVVEVIRL